MMDINRNQYFLAGLVLLLLGIQFRVVDSYTFTPEFTQIMAKQTGHPLAAVNAATPALLQPAKPAITKTIRPPEWIGWALLCVGATLIFHSMAMKKPD